MAQPTNLYDTYDTTGIREDLVDVIYSISPEDTPILSAIPRTTAASTKQAVGSATAARAMGSIPTWIATNGDAGTSGSLSTGSGTDLPNSGTDRDLTETILKTVIKEVYESGGDLDLLVVPPSVKQVISGFNANTTRFGPAESRTEYAAIDVYSSDFGDIKLVPNRVMATTSESLCLMLQSDCMQLQIVLSL